MNTQSNWRTETAFGWVFADSRAGRCQEADNELGRLFVLYMKISKRSKAGGLSGIFPTSFNLPKPSAAIAMMEMGHTKYASDMRRPQSQLDPAAHHETRIKRYLRKDGRYEIT